MGLSSLSELHQQSTESSQNVFNFSQVSIARYSSGENSVVLSTVEPDHIVPDILKHTSPDTSPDSEVEESQHQQPKHQDESSVRLDQLSPVYEKSDLESNEKTTFKSSETSDTPESSPCHENKPSESDMLVPESNQMSSQDISPSFSLHALASTIKEAGDTLLHRTEVTQEVARVTPDLIKSSSKSDQVFLTTEKFGDYDTGYALEQQDVAEKSPTIDSASLQSSPHHEIKTFNEEQSETINFSPQSSEPIFEVDSMIEQQIEFHELEVSYLQLLDSQGQQTESLGEYCDDKEDRYSPEKEHGGLELTREPLKENTRSFRNELLSQSETDSDTWIQSEKAQLSEMSPLLSSDISPQTPETVISCQHFDFGEQSSELRSASIEKTDCQSSKRPQSESFMSVATFQQLEKHFGRSLSESSQPLVNMNPELEEPVSQERIFLEEKHFDQCLSESFEPLQLSFNINSVLEESVSQDDIDNSDPEQLESESPQNLEEKHFGCLSGSSEHLEDSSNMIPVPKETSQEAVLVSSPSQVDNSMVTISKGSKRPLSESAMFCSTSQQSEEKHSGRCLSESSELMVPSLSSLNNLVFEELQKTEQAENVLAAQPAISEVDLSPVFGVESEKHHLDVFQEEQHLVIEKPSGQSPEDSISQLELTENKELEMDTEIYSTDGPKPCKDITTKCRDLSVDQNEDSDHETFFDCKQTISDCSEQEEDGPWKHTIANNLSTKILKSIVYDDRSSSAYAPSDKSPRWSIKSSDGEDFEDSPIIHEPNDDAQEKDIYFPSQGEILDSSVQTAQELPPRGGVEYNDDDGLRRVRVLSMTSPPPSFTKLPCFISG